VLDFRHWPRSVLLLLNVLVIIALFCVQFRDQLRQALARRRTHSSAKSHDHPASPKSPASPAAPANKLAEMDEKAQRELFQRMQEARKKQVI
jgi:hypothetical protein